MRLPLVCGLFVFLAGALPAQYRNHSPVLTGGFGNVVYPGGTSATVPGMQRFTPNVVYPGGGGPHLTAPGSQTRQRTWNNGGTILVPYFVPVFGNAYPYADSSTDASAVQPAAAVQQPAAQQPVVVVVYPQQPASAETAAPSLYVAPAEDRAVPTPPEIAPYLIAFKDHSIYSAVAYWVDGDTLHYFTSGNTHNQASLALVDRELTARLNREAGREVNLGSAAK